MKNFDLQPRRENNDEQCGNDFSEKTEKFDPISELEKIKHLPKEEKRQAIETYKEKLFSQKEDITELEETLSKAFRENPDGKKEYFLSLLDSEASRHNLSETQYSIFRDTIHEMAKRREMIKNMRKEFPDDQHFFKAMFGFIPAGDIDIKLGPLNFRVKISNLNDFARISEGAFISGRKITKEDLEDAESTGGRTLLSCLIDNLDHAVVIMNASEETKEMVRDNGISWSYKDMLNHEEQHVTNAFITEKKLEKYFKREIVASAEDDGDIAELLLLSMRKYEAEWDFKNEALAFLKGGANPELIQEMLMDKNGAYQSRFYAPKAKRIMRKMLGKEYEKNKALVNALARKIMGADLIKIERDALGALYMLAQSGMHRQKIIYFLQAEPLSRWPNFARRYLKRNM